MQNNLIIKSLRSVQDLLILSDLIPQIVAIVVNDEKTITLQVLVLQLAPLHFKLFHK